MDGDVHTQGLNRLAGERAYLHPASVAQFSLLSWRGRLFPVPSLPIRKSAIVTSLEKPEKDMDLGWGDILSWAALVRPLP